MSGITKRQSEVFEFIKNFIEANKYSPSYEEIGINLGLSSLSTVHKHISALRRRGKITTIPEVKRSIEIV